MKNFLKSILIFLLGFVVISSIAIKNPNNSSNENIQLNSTIASFEEDIKNGSVVEDGILDDTKVEENETNNAMANIFQKIGNGVTKGIGAILKFFSSLISKFIS